jgi:transcriptional regulator with XRE-family HTH domain
MEVHHKIRALRLSKNYTQNYIADVLGIDATNYSRMERGSAKIPLDRLHKIAEILDTDISTLLSISNSNEIKSDDQSICGLLKGILVEVQAIRKSLETKNVNNLINNPK